MNESGDAHLRQTIAELRTTSVWSMNTLMDYTEWPGTRLANECPESNHNVVPLLKNDNNKQKNLDIFKKS